MLLYTIRSVIDNAIHCLWASVLCNIFDIDLSTANKTRERLKDIITDKKTNKQILIFILTVIDVLDSSVVKKSTDLIQFFNLHSYVLDNIYFVKFLKVEGLEWKKYSYL